MGLRRLGTKVRRLAAVRTIGPAAKEGRTQAWNSSIEVTCQLRIKGDRLRARAPLRALLHSKPRAPTRLPAYGYGYQPTDIRVTDSRAMGISAIRDTPLIPVLRVYEYPGDAEQPAYSGPSGYGFSGDPGNPRIRHLDTRAALPLSRPLCDRGIHELGLITPRSETDEDGLVRPVGRPVRPRKSPGTSGSNTGRGRASDETASSVRSSLPTVEHNDVLAPPALVRGTS
jgi:hypothetical protein